MHIAFAIFKFFPHGGSARDLAKIVSRCRERGHEARIYALEWQGPRLDGVEIVVLAVPGVRSHVRQRRFAGLVSAHVAGHPVDLVVGMNKMPGLDVYYAADSCYEEKARTQRPWAYRLAARYRHYAEFERIVFAEQASTHILTIAPDQDVAFKAIYRTPAHRFHPLPPGIERDRESTTVDAGCALRSEFGISDADILLLFVGSGFVKKGLDRVFAGLAALPVALRDRVRLFVVGDDKAARFRRLARRLRIARQVRFVGGRDDVAVWLRAADALVLPAYDEAAGMVILEAACAGLPVLATANCGYAPWLREAAAGIVTPVPFERSRFNADLERLLTSDERTEWSRRGLELGAKDGLDEMAPRAVELLESFGSGGRPPLVSFCALEYSKTDPRYRSLVPIARACRRRGMNVRVFVGERWGSVPDGLDVVDVPVTAIRRAKRLARRREWVAESLRRAPAACVVGFESMPGIDLYHGTKSLVAAGRDILYAFDEMPLGLEQAPTPPQRPREALRAEYGFEADEIVFAMVGSDLASRGFERMLMALGRLPDALRERAGVLAAGRLGHGRRAVERVLKISGRVSVDHDLSALDAIEAADALVDLPYRPSSNGWLFDTLAAGRPVFTCASVQESTMVGDAGAGVVLASPFRQGDLNRALADYLGSADKRTQWSANAARFAAAPENFGRADRVAAFIEQHARSRGARAESLSA